MSAEKLYTPEVLGLATRLAAYPWDEGLPLQGEARSKSCGSSIALGLGVDAAGRIERVGIRSHACAIGQAAAAIFASGVIGRDAAQILSASDGIDTWLAGSGDAPDWPGLAAIALARDYPGRHGAIVLAWRAASDILPSD